MTQAALFARMTLAVMALMLGLSLSSPSHAISGSSIQVGYGVERTQATQVSLRWDWNKYWSLSEKWNVSGFWEAGLGYMQSDGVGERNIWDVGFTPVLRLRPSVSRFYLEGGIGARYLTHDRLNDSRHLGSKLLFNDILGFGWNLGEKDRYELGYRFQHYSNANMVNPNDGVNLHMIRLGFNY
jgi:lipid A 3-O-deacylase